MKPKINFKKYESIDSLDEEEKSIWKDMQSGKFRSILTTNENRFDLELPKRGLAKRRAIEHSDD